MGKVFISDAHLRMEKDDNYRLLLDFLSQLPGETDTLFILGDLFEFWVGYPSLPFPHYRQILETLRSIRAKGVRIVYFEGNHDFHMGPFFTETLAAQVFPGPAILDLDGVRTYLCHGDQVNSSDYGYRLLRLILHSRATASLIPLIPPSVVSYIAERMGRASRNNHDRRQNRWDYPAMLRRFAADRLRQGCDAVIVGHFHIPLLEKLEEGKGGTLLSLGDWTRHFTYGELNNGRFTLNRYDPS